MAFDYDLVLKGGEVVDPAQGLRAVRDVGFKDGLVAAVEADIPPAVAAEVVDVAGKLVAPGLIDLHGHFAHRIYPYRADPDSYCLAVGVTTAVDAGSVGWANFQAFRDYVIGRVDTRMYAFVHLSTLGLTTLTTMGIPDLEDFRWARAEEAIRCIQENRDVVLGVKVRLSPTGTTAANAVPAIEMARRVADETDSKMMVHVMESPLPLDQVFGYLKAGDIATHIFHGDVHNVLDEAGQVRQHVREAQQRGVVFDTAGAMRHCSIPVSRAAVEQGVPPDTISTDRNQPRSGMVNYDLLEHMSIFLELGVPLDDVIRMVTVNASDAIGREELGTLRPGSIGDAAVLELEEGEFGFEDGLGNSLRASRRFAPVLTVKDGARWRPRWS
ncbi:MAG: amidohydrolase family protein [Dehalococcoidia bacterium]|nr:amidohydrolase family protein [Dehalococcoidia bacterium]